MSTADEGFLARWARRKSGDKTPPDAQPRPSTEMRPAAVEAASPGAPAASGAPAAPAAAEPVPLPTMEDVAALTRGSDYSRFVQPGVGRDVSNAAMKKLFSDPHFNVMDGLDTYIDDYGKADPIPPAMLRLMNQAVSLGLFDDEPAADPPAAAPAAAQACPDGGARTPLAQSATPPPTAPAPSSAASVPDPAPDLCPDDDPDLRLQPDDAPGRRGPEPGPRA